MNTVLSFIQAHQTELYLALVLATLGIIIHLARVALQIKDGYETCSVIIVSSVLPDVEYNFSPLVRYELSEIPTVYKNLMMLPGIKHPVRATYGQIVYSVSDRRVYVSGMFGFKLCAKLPNAPAFGHNGDCYQVFLFGRWRDVMSNCVKYLSSAKLIS